MLNFVLALVSFLSACAIRSDLILFARTLSHPDYLPSTWRYRADWRLQLIVALFAGYVIVKAVQALKKGPAGSWLLQYWALLLGALAFLLALLPLRLIQAVF